MKVNIWHSKIRVASLEASPHVTSPEASPHVTSLEAGLIMLLALRCFARVNACF